MIARLKAGILPIAAIATESTIMTSALLDTLKGLVPDDFQVAAGLQCLVVRGRNASHNIVNYATQHHVCAIVLGVRHRAQLTSYLSIHGLAWILANATGPVYTFSHCMSEIDLTQFEAVIRPWQE